MYTAVTEHTMGLSQNKQETNTINLDMLDLRSGGYSDEYNVCVMRFIMLVWCLKIDGRPFTTETPLIALYSSLASFLYGLEMFLG